MKNRSFNPIELMAKKRDAGKLHPGEIKWFIDSFTNGQIENYQMSAMLMAMFIRGLDKSETAALTDAMLYSGDTIKFSDKFVVDKHSTGGVGDKTSFILAPIAAACGVKVPMMAGRGLGHTGGTVDKIEAIPGFQTTLSLEKFKEQVLTKGLALIGQTDSIAPADKRIYALRDVTATVESIPLITASIMSKKLAEGANGIVMDIKTGNGAFMSDIKKARALSKSLLATASRFDKKMVAIISDMNQPLGKMVGNSLELIECFEVLKNQGPSDTTELSLELAASMIYIAGKAKTIELARKKSLQALRSGQALEIFKNLIKLQGGDSAVVENYQLLPLASEKSVILATKNEYIKSFNCRAFGEHCVELGGGRHKLSDQIDFGVGLEIHCRVGDQVNKGDPLVTIYHHHSQQLVVDRLTQSILKNDIKFQKSKVKPLQLIKEVLEN